MHIAKGGLSWIAGSFLVTGLFCIFTVVVAGELRFVFFFLLFVMLLISCLFLIFFRDPNRIIGDGIVAVADGIIREIITKDDGDVGDCTKISTFMNLYHVHVNRMPFDGCITEIIHHPGAHLPAFRKESEKNERVIILLDTMIGTVKIIQIAGTLARRIVPYINKGDMLKKGDKIGLIRLGSRVDVYLPTKTLKQVTITKGARVKAGETTIAKFND
ncbi:MAG: phosphatidylserine decarboxylase [Euryarchaeota archaeon]|nr:phosphatidylserine decarboxylase [Euryarchaeota archaeon]